VLQVSENEPRACFEKIPASLFQYTLLSFYGSRNAAGPMMIHPSLHLSRRASPAAWPNRQTEMRIGADIAPICASHRRRNG
jgi:hypothetical protein